MNTSASQPARISRTELLMRVRGIASDLLAINPALLRESARLRTDLMLSPAAIQALLVKVEAQIGLKFELRDLGLLVGCSHSETCTFGQLIDFVEGAVSGGIRS